MSPIPSAARCGGRPLVHRGALYRFGQDCGATYGHKLRAYKVSLTKVSFSEVKSS